MNKNNIDKQAEAEALALRRAGRRDNFNNSRTRKQTDYSRHIFEKLFVDKLHKRKK